MAVDGARASEAAREFLAEWVPRDRHRLGSAAEDVVAAMDMPAQCVVYAAAEQFLDDITVSSSTASAAPGLSVYVNPHPGHEYRWQLAALVADVVILRRPRWDPLLFPSLRTLCSEPDQDPPARLYYGPETEAVTFIDELVESDPMFDFSPAANDERRRCHVPPTLSRLLRFIAHLSAIGPQSRVYVAEPALHSAWDVFDSIKGVCFDAGRWYESVRDPTSFGSAITRSGALSGELRDEILASYAVAGIDRGHIPLVPSSESCYRAAVEFYSRFRGLDFGFAMISNGYPRAELVGDNPGTDWRPALVDRLLLSSFPAVRTSDLATFDYLHDLPHLTDFRDRLRRDAERCEPATAHDAARRLEEISLELRDAGGAAARQLGENIESGRRRLALVGALAFVSTAAGFITSGPAGAVAAGALGASLTALVERDAIDPTATMDGTKLALLSFASGAPAPRAHKHSPKH